jgi:hypothetical protein
MGGRWVENRPIVENGWNMHEKWMENKSIVEDGWKI